MARLPIVLYPEAFLRQKCVEVEQFDEDLAQLTRDMAETMYDAPGIGRAAPQGGIGLRVALGDVSSGEDPEGLLVMVNPVIESTAGLETAQEGCLSIPDFQEKVTRPAEIQLRYQDIHGELHELATDELEARGFAAGR